MWVDEFQYETQYFLRSLLFEYGMASTDGAKHKTSPTHGDEVIAMTPGKLFKNHCGKARADFGRRSVAVYMSLSKSGSNAVQNGFFNSSHLPGAR